MSEIRYCPKCIQQTFPVKTSALCRQLQVERDLYRDALDSEVISVIEELGHTNRRLEEREVFEDGVTIAFNRLKTIRAKALEAGKKIREDK